MDVYTLDAQLQDMTPHQLKIIEALYHAGGEWMTRSQVAKALDKKRLTPYDIQCLQMLTDMGLAIMSTQPTSAPGSDFAYIYNMPDETAELIQNWVEIRDELKAEKQVRKRKPIKLQRD